VVKKDLQRVGIPYETEEGIADCHAAGRHTHITELLRNGASLPEAQKLARHSDIKMTMKYTHIGMDDQAKALGNLPSGLLHPCCISGVSDSQQVATTVATADLKECLNLCGCMGLGTDCQIFASAGNMEAAGIEPASSEADCESFVEFRSRDLTIFGSLLQRTPSGIRRIPILGRNFCRLYMLNAYGNGRVTDQTHNDQLGEISLEFAALNQSSLRKIDLN
jgi:hypothetical protein